MSNLEELIERLCPDGVEYKILGDISCKISDGMHNLPKNIKSSGEYPILSAQNITNGNINIDTSKWVNHEIFERENKRNNVEKCDVLLTIVGAIGRTAVVKDNLKALFQRSVCVIKPNVKLLNSKFLYYVLNSTVVQSYIQNNAKGAAQKGLYLKQVAKIKLPVPPLEVQREIVRILDNFTFLTAELAAELAARQKQYEYYLNSILDFSNSKEIKWMNVGDCFEFKNGLNKGKEFFGQGDYIVNFTDVYNNRYLTKNMLKGRVLSDQNDLEKYDVRFGDVFFTRTSETKEDIGMSSVVIENIPRCVFSGFVLRARPKTQNWLPKFCSYYFSTKKVRDEIVRHASFTTRALTSGPRLSKLQIPLIPLAEQQRIVDILDRFDTLCNDISSGLPAEIEARQKQYEHYRDKLLTFKELKKEA